MGKGFITYEDEKPRKKSGGGSRRGTTRRALKNLNKPDFGKARKSAGRLGGAAGRAGGAVRVGIVMLTAYFIMGMADQYLGIYAWMMGSIAILDRLSSGDLVSKDLYMNLGILALVLLVILKIGTYGGKKRPWKGYKPR